MDSTPSGGAAEMRTQWVEPSDVFSVLLILGGDVIQLALATLAGRMVTPVAFSFGWVAYSISALLSAIGENRLVQCEPEVSMLAINLKSGYCRANKSWLLARVMKTYEFWMPAEVRKVLQNPRVYKDEEAGKLLPGGTVTVAPEGGEAALCVSVYAWSTDLESGVPRLDWVWWSGLIVSPIQLGIAAIPFGLHNDWSVFLVTACGTLLAYASGAIPQWRHEKWHARRTRKDVALTLGNGSRHVIIILGADGALDLEDLAAGRTEGSRFTRICTFILSILWLVLLITSTGIKTNTWYLLAVGGLGMLHNLIVAGVPRVPAAFGLPIKLMQMPGQDAVPAIFAERKVMWTLMELEDKYKKFGKSLVSEFFPGKLFPWEEQWWDATDEKVRRTLLQQAQEKLARKEEEARQNPASAVLE